MAGRLLTLDLSSNIGWARFDRPGQPPRFGTLRYEARGANRICGLFSDWLHVMWGIDPWDAMAWEKPLLLPTDTVAKLEILYGLVGVVRAFVGSERLHGPTMMPHREVDVPAVKKRLTGSARAQKPDMIKACWSVGWKVASDHEADALGVGLVSYRDIWPVARSAA